MKKLSQIIITALMLFTTAEAQAEWSALGTGVIGGGGISTNPAVSPLAVDNAGNLYASGKFTSAGGVMVNSIAKWNGTAWSALGSGMILYPPL